MKTLVASSILFCVLMIALLPTISSGQTIILNSVSATNFCLGDSISVTFTVSGNWSQNKNNVFTIQLSDVNGSFDTKFTNFGSLKDTADGQYTFSSLFNYINTSNRYRIRVTGSYPYVVSADNGQDITVGRLPNPGFAIYDFSTSITTRNAVTMNLSVGAQVGSSVHILLPTDPLNPDPLQNTTNYAWDFGSDATPPSASGLGAIEQSVSYSTPGDKIISLALTGATGCTTSAAKIKYHIFDCSQPVIPKYAMVDTGDLHGISNSVIWVNPGVAFGVSGTGDTIFCEANSAIYDRGGGNVIYLKPGATYSDLGHGSGSTLIYADGVSLDLHTPYYNAEIHCPNLDFDYTNAPPNAAHPLSDVQDIAAASIAVYPNPANNRVTLGNLPASVVSIEVLNILGASVMKVQRPNEPSLILDISTLDPGTYYIRMSSARSVLTKKIIKN